MLPESNSLKKIYNKRRRVRNIYKRKKCIPEYLKDNNFEVELNYKLWVTKGARFKASERCEEFAYAKNYSVQARNYHECALEIAKLYNSLRSLKVNPRHSLYEVNKIKDEYEKILDRYNNHLPIDLMMFKLEKKEYFNISILSYISNHVRYFILVRSAYYFCVFILPVLYCIICMINSGFFLY